jgi:hypothetical protein
MVMNTEVFSNTKGKRIIGTQFPPIAIYEDAADFEDFEILYQLQSRVNPRLKAEAGNYALLNKSEIPFNIHGCSYAVAPFVHLSPSQPSRFSDNTAFGVLYVANTIETAILEVTYHYAKTLAETPDLKTERFIAQELSVTFSAKLTDIRNNKNAHKSNDYDTSQALALKLRVDKKDGLVYNSVRNPHNDCYALFSPKLVEVITTGSKFEFLYANNQLTEVNKLTPFGLYTI